MNLHLFSDKCKTRLRYNETRISQKKKRKYLWLSRIKKRFHGNTNKRQRSNNFNNRTFRWKYKINSTFENSQIAQTHHPSNHPKSSKIIQNHSKSFSKWKNNKYKTMKNQPLNKSYKKNHRHDFRPILYTTHTHALHYNT